ncbi:MAG: hypothetical protein J3K34DRAFT_425178 [Monoraphidium minutum]|nr:MAG: hypothetical protein J3K34DRAFT_425178 [Monoraphidium minutum]
MVLLSPRGTIRYSNRGEGVVGGNTVSSAAPSAFGMASTVPTPWCCCSAHRKRVPSASADARPGAGACRPRPLHSSASPIRPDGGRAGCGSVLSQRAGGGNGASRTRCAPDCFCRGAMGGWGGVPRGCCRISGEESGRCGAWRRLVEPGGRGQRPCTSHCWHGAVAGWRDAPAATGAPACCWQRRRPLRRSPLPGSGARAEQWCSQGSRGRGGCQRLGGEGGQAGRS